MGVPQTTCLSYAKKEIGDSLRYLGVAAFMCGLLMLCTWICQYALWRTYDENDVSHYEV
jgi:hypothetical protein